MSCFACQVSGVTCHISHVRCHVSGVTCQVSHVTCFFLQRGWASWWGICYQWVYCWKHSWQTDTQTDKQTTRTAKNRNWTTTLLFIHNIKLFTGPIFQLFQGLALWLDETSRQEIRNKGNIIDLLNCPSNVYIQP